MSIFRLTIIFILALWFFALPGAAQERDCACVRVAKEKFSAEGTIAVRELIEAGKVKQIRGKIDAPIDFENFVIEVYKLSRNEFKQNYFSIYEITRRRKRKMVCQPTSDGLFCFHNLSNGFYVLKIGISASAMLAGQVDASYLLVEVDKKDGIDKETEVPIYIAH